VRYLNIKKNSHSNIISPVVCGCETWSPIFKEEQRLTVFENRVLRIFGLNSYKIIDDWRKLLREKLHDWYCSRNAILVIKPSLTKLMMHLEFIGGEEIFTQGFGGET
jgi:hypothetical protein